MTDILLDGGQNFFWIKFILLMGLWNRNQDFLDRRTPLRVTIEAFTLSSL